MASASHNRRKKAQGSGVGNWTIIPDNLMVRNEQGRFPSSERREHTLYTRRSPFPPLTAVTFRGRRCTEDNELLPGLFVL